MGCHLEVQVTSLRNWSPISRKYERLNLHRAEKTISDIDFNIYATE